MRQELYASRIIEQFRVRVIVGKGGMGEATRRTCAARGCVYLQAVGGTATLLAERVERVLAVHLLKEFGAAEAVWELDLSDLEAVVTMDTQGRSLHRNVRMRSKRALNRLLRAG